MPEFKVTETDGTARTIAARRMTREGRYLWFHDNTGGGGWAAVERVDCTRVAHVARCITEPNGFMRWVTQPIPSTTEVPGP